MGILVDYIYEIDLDHHIFYMDSGEPLFDFRNMPYGNEFLMYIGEDSYSRICFHVRTPEKHPFKLPPPAKVDSDVLDAYSGYNVRFVADPHNLLDLPVNSRPIEQVRVKITYLRFLPEDHIDRQDTPGITALARLGQLMYENTLHDKLFTNNAIYHQSASQNPIHNPSKIIAFQLLLILRNTFHHIA
ncbi:hypothetical protein GGU10DRAFT_379300 [Lentinula aff. detonsa]|uniref:Uncharacterized protein n=1 Tax=Lentinula aff. detonsa TaxID=2804958 RepID=A0AA38L3H8_9AGAR|nr:hypothetical protein GGU10DRAFT_379300 [Lentinula aff. detonsa]